MDTLIKRIHQLCKGDKAKAKRLIDTARIKYPNQSDLWYLQKVIADLEQEQAKYFQQRRGKALPKTSQTNIDSWEQKVRLHQAEHFRRDNGKTSIKSQSPQTPQAPTSVPVPAPNPSPLPPPPPPSLNPPVPAPPQQPERVQTPPAILIKPSTWNRLLVLLNGNQATAERLMTSARFRYTGKSEQWLAEKVVFDLERDRH